MAGAPAQDTSLRSQLRAIEAWNAAAVYQRAIALMGRQIDGARHVRGGDALAS